jgi:hypothetical protein
MDKVASLNRKRVGRKVVEQIKEGKRINIKKAMTEVGYKENYANTIGAVRIRNSKEFKEETKTFLDQLEDRIQASIEDMAKKQTKASYRDNAEVVDKFRKLSSALKGNNLEGNAIEITLIEKELD